MLRFTTLPLDYAQKKKPLNIANKKERQKIQRPRIELTTEPVASFLSTPFRPRPIASPFLYFADLIT